MNRLHQLKETLPQNIKDNEDYDNLEFVVLDYNSQDGMEAWVRENLGRYISQGRLVYYRTHEPTAFSHSHAKNLSFKLATGDIVCNINADHYTGPDFASYVNSAFTEESNILLSPIDFHRTKNDYHPPKDVLGKVCLRKMDFLKIRGFDEQIKTYGFEDYDFVNRLEMTGVRRVLIEDFSFLRFIPHDEEERYSLQSGLANIAGIYIHYCTPSISELLFLFNDHTFEKGTLVDNATIGADLFEHAYESRKYKFEFSVKETRWIGGRWSNGGRQDGINVYSEDENDYCLNKRTSNNCSFLLDETEEKAYYPVSDADTIRNLMVFNFFFRSRGIMEKNLRDKRTQVNDQDFGKAVVFKNFEFGSPIPV